MAVTREDLDKLACSAPVVVVAVAGALSGRVVNGRPQS
jgi:hypothetical protein